MVNNEFMIEIIQTVKVKKKIKANNENDAIKKGNMMVEMGKIDIKQCELLEADIKIVPGKVIKLCDYKLKSI